jgi:AcrR family transcriptional regulator
LVKVLYRQERPVDGTAVRQRTARPRADASRNRDRIVAAAREAFVEHGAEAPLDEIAQRAGVGNATLYRHFVNRRDLIRTVILSLMSETADQAEKALAEEPDAFEALRRFVHQAADQRIGALCPMLSDWMDKDDPELLAVRDRLARTIEAIMDRARRSGQMRTDVAIGDVMVSLTQLTRPLPGTGWAEMDRFAHRHLELLLDGLRTPQRSVLPGSAATLEGLRQCVKRSGAD